MSARCTAFASAAPVSYTHLQHIEAQRGRDEDALLIDGALLGLELVSAVARADGCLLYTSGSFFSEILLGQHLFEPGEAGERILLRELGLALNEGEHLSLIHI